MTKILILLGCAILIRLACTDSNQVPSYSQHYMYWSFGCLKIKLQLFNLKIVPITDKIYFRRSSLKHLRLIISLNKRKWNILILKYCLEVKYLYLQQLGLYFEENIEIFSLLYVYTTNFPNCIQRSWYFFFLLTRIYILRKRMQAWTFWRIHKLS